ncbi:MAG: YraN family protein [Tissierellia bacterium]|nr:YraN family protein [Tissierellia bacterium]
MRNNRNKGIIGENLAVEHLVNKGYGILERNYRTKIGEIDIIAIKNNTLIFVEVKTRTSANFGFPYEAVNKRKFHKILKTSLVYIKQKGYKGYQVRYDIIEVFLSNKRKINHIENVFCL